MNLEDENEEDGRLKPLELKALILNKLIRNLEELEALNVKKGWGVKMNIIKSNLKKSIYWAKQLK